MIAGADNTKGVIMERLYDAVCKMQTEGCSVGKVHTQELNETCRRVTDLEAKFWLIIVLCFTTLIGIAFDIGLNLMRLRISIPIG